MSMEDGSRNSNRSKTAFGEAADDSDLLPARARAYLPPTVVPRETEFRTFRMRRVEISPEADLRRQATVLRLPKPEAPRLRRRSPGLALGCLSLAGASGGCLVWLLLNVAGGGAATSSEAAWVSVKTASVQVAPNPALGSAPASASAALETVEGRGRSEQPAASPAPPLAAVPNEALGSKVQPRHGAQAGHGPVVELTARQLPSERREGSELMPSEKREGSPLKRAASSSSGTAAPLGPAAPKRVGERPLPTEPASDWPIRPPMPFRREQAPAKAPEDEVWVKPKAPKVWLE